jgi:hypothetical protein
MEGDYWSTVERRLTSKGPKEADPTDVTSNL